MIFGNLVSKVRNITIKSDFLFLLFLWVSFLACSPSEVALFEDDFSNLQRGPISVEVGAHTEYHYLPEAVPKSDWAVSTFTWESGFMRAWEVRDIAGDRMIVQNFSNEPGKHAHPMLVAGDPLWQDYSVEFRFSPKSKEQQSGLVFRYRNDRCYYFFGIKGDSTIIKMVKHATDFRKPFEVVLAKAPIIWDVGESLLAHVDVIGDQIKAMIKDVTLETADTTFGKGRIALMSDIPTHFSSVRVTCSPKEHQRFLLKKKELEEELDQLRKKNPKPVVWKKIDTQGFGVGRNLRFGDLNGDGQLDVLIGQVLHHGPSDRNSELSCLTAMTFDGERLWQIGTPDNWKNHLTNDVAFQIHDLDNDGRNEVIYCKELRLIVADGATGRTKYQVATPEVTDQEDINPSQHNRFGRILGDCLYFCDLRGQGYDGDIIIKDRYRRVWALDDALQVMWYVNINTGHYPYAYDIDDDGKDELVMGYTLLDDNGEIIWDLNHMVEDHADGVAIVRFQENADPLFMCAASDEGVFFTDLEGNIIKHHQIGHGQNPAIANFRDDLPGIESLAINFWGNQGIIHYFDAEGNIYHDFEPNQYGSMCLPINWSGNAEEYFVHNPNVDEGGLFDGWGRKVVEFPDDGHPEMCNAVMDITGDCRDEIVVWDANRIWVYTQDDNPKTGRLYRPYRNPLYNYSNYQTTVSLPGWKEE